MLATAPGHDEVPHVHSADGDGAGEWSDDALERDQLFKPTHVGAAGLDVGGGGFARCRLLGGFLLGHGRGFQQLFPAVVGGLGQMQVGLSQIKFGPGLRELLVQVRGLNEPEQLACLHMGADVRNPVF